MDLEAQTVSTVETIRKFDNVLNAHDIEAVMALMTDDCVFDNTYPAPDGTRHEGKAAVRAAFEEFLRDSPNAHFDEEELVALGDRAFLRWRYSWTDAAGAAGHVRGVDIIKVRDGKIAESLAYVKG
jgi:ketosteroid isomerase-like protein